MEWRSQTGSLSEEIQQFGSLDSVRGTKSVLIFDLDDTLVYSDNTLYEKEEYPGNAEYGSPIPSAVEFVRYALQKKVECYILTANGNVEDIMAKVRTFANAVGRGDLFKYILYRSKPGYYKKTYEKILELYYGEVSSPEIPYPIFFFDNAKDQIDSVAESAGEARCLFAIHVERADLESTWEGAKRVLAEVSPTTLRKLGPVVLTPRPSASAESRGKRKTRRRMQKK